MSTRLGRCRDKAPHVSRIRGVATRVAQHGLEVLPNMNTPESTADQYLSMVLERGVVDQAQAAPNSHRCSPPSKPRRLDSLRAWTLTTLGT